MPKESASLRGVYGKPLLKRDAPNVAQMPLPMLKKAAEIILDSIKREIKKDMAKTAGLRGRGKPVPIPDSQKFVDSFTYRVKGKSTIEITSDWPTASTHTISPDGSQDKASKPYPMTWLTGPRIKTVPLVTQKGQVIFRTAPLTTANAWIHPGFLRYTFIERGVKKGRVRVMEEMAEEILMLFLSEGALF